MIFDQCSANKSKKLRMIALLAVMVLLLASCGKTEPPDQTKSNSTGTTSASGVGEQKTVTTLDAETGYYYDYYWDDASERVVASIKYPYMRLSESYRKTYPKLEKAVAGLMNERKDSRMELYSEAIRAAKESANYNSEHSDQYEVSETVTVRRADTEVLSLMLDGYYYVGGPHGAPYSIGAVFDTKTGERLKLTDVVTNEGLFYDLVKEQLEAFWDTDYFYEDLDLIRFLQNNLEDIAWVLDYHGLSIYFQPYDIAPYASGIQNITISFASHPELIKEKYREVPESYGIEFTEEKPFFFDVDGDGKSDSLTVSAAKGEYANYEKQTVTLNGKTFEEDTGIYLIEPMLMHMGDGKNYLYIGQQYPDDCWAFEVFDLSQGTVRKVDTVYSGRHNIVDCENLRQVLTDPNSFILDTHTLMLGTAYGYDSYHVGTHGLPVQEHNWYMICFETELTLCKDLIASVVSEDGKTKGTTELKIGDKVLYYRTDGETWADLKLSDGRLVRVNPKHGDGEWTLDGINLEEVFEGIVFGG